MAHAGAAGELPPPAEDAVYAQASKRPKLGAPDEAERDESVVVSVGSFTKILAPGLRLGWIEAAPALLNMEGGKVDRLDHGLVLNLFWRTVFLQGLVEVDHKLLLLVAGLWPAD